MCGACGRCLASAEVHHAGGISPNAMHPPHIVVYWYAGPPTCAIECLPQQPASCPRTGPRHRRYLPRRKLSAHQRPLNASERMAGSDWSRTFAAEASAAASAVTGHWVNASAYDRWTAVTGRSTSARRRGSANDCSRQASTGPSDSERTSISMESGQPSLCCSDAHNLVCRKHQGELRDQCSIRRSAISIRCSQ